MSALMPFRCFALAALASSAFAQDIIQPGTLARGSAPQPLAAVPNGYIVVFAPGTSRADRAAAAMLAGASIRHNYTAMDGVAITAPNTNAVEALRRNPRVTRITPDFVVRGEVKPPNPGGGGTLNFDTRQVISNEVQRVGMPAAGSDGSGIGVALLDSGIDFNHPDLRPAPNTAATSFNAISPGASCQDNGGHGTHIAGLIAAQNNTIGIVGVAPAARLYCVKVLGADLTGSDSDIIAGLDWVFQNRNSVNPPIRW